MVLAIARNVWGTFVYGLPSTTLIHLRLGIMMSEKRTLNGSFICIFLYIMSNCAYSHMYLVFVICGLKGRFYFGEHVEESAGCDEEIAAVWFTFINC